MIVGYLRVSTGKQNLANQQDEIRRFAESRNFTVNSWVTEVVSGKKNERERKLGTLLKRMKPGDTLIVTEISRLSRTLTDIMAIMGKCLSREINLYTTKEGYSFDNSINSKVLCFAFGLVAEIERNLISMRTKEALALRKAEGVTLGRRKGSYTKTNILMANRQAIIEMLNNDKSIGDICKRFDISRDTFTKFRKRYPSVQLSLITHLRAHETPEHLVCRLLLEKKKKKKQTNKMIQGLQYTTQHVNACVDARITP